MIKSKQHLLNNVKLLTEQLKTAKSVLAKAYPMKKAKAKAKKAKKSKKR
jgi:hypothetical protein